MTKPILKCARIVAGVGEGIAAGVSQHVRMDRERQSCALADALYQAVDGIRSEWPAALGSEHEAAIGKLPL